MIKSILKRVFIFALVTSLSACGKKLPDPVESKNGFAWIPIADTAFLIPEKTWLKSYGRKSTDGSVASFELHVTAPDVQPWSEAVNAKMYPTLGPGQMVRVELRDIGGELLASQYEEFYILPQRWGGLLLEEIGSDLNSSGLRKFRAPQLNDPVFYLRIENERVKYFTRCDEDKDPPNRQFCHLRFPWSRTIYVELVFTRNYLPHSVLMADQIAAKLKEFEVAGRNYQSTAGSEQ